MPSKPFPTRPDRATLGLTPDEWRTLERLKTPAQIQDFISAIPANYEPEGDTYLSVQQVLRQRRAHCIEGALVAACALWIHGEPPLLWDLSAVRDVDHVVTLFRRGPFWGVISKSNHSTLRWRDPVYRTLRELALSYLHEYTNERGEKTLRTYSGAWDLRRIPTREWVDNPKNCLILPEILTNIRHYPVIPPARAGRLRRLEEMELQVKRLRQYPDPRVKA